MDLQQLKHYLLAAGVPDDRYLLVGLDVPRAVREGACIVRPNQRGWEVLVWRPVRVEPSLTFLSEDEACERALDMLTSAITTSEGSTNRPGISVGSPASSVPAPGGPVPGGMAAREAAAPANELHALSSGHVNPGPH